MSYNDLIIINCNKCQEGKELDSMRAAGETQAGFETDMAVWERKF